jgi:hypothetical protein
MDQTRDYDKFRRLIGRLCETLGKPITDELLESWWKALRHVDFESVEYRVDRFLARADESTKFPRPSQMRPQDSTPPDDPNVVRNHVRDYWRSAVVNDTARSFGITPAALEPIIVEHAQTLGGSMLQAIDDLCQQELRDGRTTGQHRACQRWCEGIANSYGELVTRA